MAERRAIITEEVGMQRPRQLQQPQRDRGIRINSPRINPREYTPLTPKKLKSFFHV
jgi:hypothetical protein